MKLKSSFVYRGFIRPMGLRARMLSGELGYGSHKLPDRYKYRVVRRYVRRYRPRVLVETGTATGGLIDAVKDDVARIYSIELDETLHQRAKQRFRADSHVQLIHGDSEDVLPPLVRRINEPCLFWLDAHAMVGGARGRQLTPVREELDCILRGGGTGVVVLIDDARLFVGGGYPGLSEIEERVRERWPGAGLTVRNDIIRIVNAPA